MGGDWYQKMGWLSFYYKAHMFCLKVLEKSDQQNEFKDYSASPTLSWSNSLNAIKKSRMVMPTIAIVRKWHSIAPITLLKNT